MNERVTLEATRHQIVVLQASFDKVMWQTVDEGAPQRRPDLWYRLVTYTMLKLDTGQSILESSEAGDPWRVE